MTQLKSNPIIGALRQDERVVKIEGYVGKSGDGQIDLYPRLSPITHLVVDSSDIVHIIMPEKDDEPASIFVRDSAEVQVVSTVKAAALRGRQNRGVGLLDACSDFAYEEWLECLDVGFGIDFCNDYSRLIDRACRDGRIAPRVGPAALE